MRTEHIAEKAALLRKLADIAAGMTGACPEPVRAAISVLDGNEEPYADVKAAYGWLEAFGGAVRKAGGEPDPLIHEIMDDLKAAAGAA